MISCEDTQIWQKSRNVIRFGQVQRGGGGHSFFPRFSKFLNGP